MNGANWSDCYPLIVEAAARIKVAAILDAEVVWIDLDGVTDFAALHSRVNDHRAIGCAFDLLILDGDDLRKKPFSERKAALRKVLKHTRLGVQYVEHIEGDGREMFKQYASSALRGSFSKRINAPYRSGPSKSWLKTKNPKAAAATRVADGSFRGWGS